MTGVWVVVAAVAQAVLGLPALHARGAAADDLAGERYLFGRYPLAGDDAQREVQELLRVAARPGRAAHAQ